MRDHTRCEDACPRLDLHGPVGLSYGEENYHVFLYEVRDFVEVHNRVADVDFYLSIVDFWMAPMQFIDHVSQLLNFIFHSPFNINIPSDYVCDLPALV